MDINKETSNSPAVDHEAVKAARDLLGFHSLLGGVSCGGFRSKLFVLWASADGTNRARLAAAFPHEAVAFDALNGPSGSIEALQELAGYEG